jgi:diguanylate cyclase (GGDEF)-like protein
MIISPNISKEEVFILAEKLRYLIHDFKFEKVGLKTISLGVSDLQDGDTSYSLIKRADNALYQAKNSGRDKTVMI